MLSQHLVQVLESLLRISISVVMEESTGNSCHHLRMIFSFLADYFSKPFYHFLIGIVNADCRVESLHRCPRVKIPLCSSCQGYGQHERCKNCQIISDHLHTVSPYIDGFLLSYFTMYAQAECLHISDAQHAILRHHVVEHHIDVGREEHTHMA